MSSQSQLTNVGIDVSKGTLDIAVHETQEHWTIKHDPAQFDSLVACLRARTPERVLIEATGGIQTLLVSHLAAAGLPVIVMNPRQVRDFARGLGQLAKTDRIDALMLGWFGAIAKPEIRPLKSRKMQELEGLVARRTQLVNMLSVEQIRLKQAQQQHQHSIVTDLMAHIDWLKARLLKCEGDLSKLIRSSPLWRETDDLLQSVPGIGPATSLVLIADLPELGQLKHKQIASLCGLAPHACDSGKHRGKRTTRGGRSRVRTVLYMATLVATTHNETIKTFYRRLLSAGKLKKVALTACMRKLLVILNAMMRNKTSWQSNRC